MTRSWTHDKGEEVLVKKHKGERDFVITMLEVSVRGMCININAE